MKTKEEILLDTIRENFSATTLSLAEEALAFAHERLDGRTRYDGSPLVEHSVAVAQIVISEVGLGRNSTVAALLHDAVRICHKEQSPEEFLALTGFIRTRFGEQAAGIAVGLCNISEINLKISK